LAKACFFLGCRALSEFHTIITAVVFMALFGTILSFLLIVANQRLFV
jgi:hypothetical protein